jgi:putative ABC transport system permease protein
MIFIPLKAAGLINKGAPPSKKKMYPDVSELIIAVQGSQLIPDSVPVIKRILEVAHNGVKDYQIIVPQEILNQSRKIQRIFNMVLGSIAFISLLVGGIGIMNIMIATVSERTREIGMRRAFGATYNDIIIQFLAESTILTITGGIIGIAAGSGCILLVAFIAKWKTDITILSLLLPLLTSTATGMVFGLYPAYTAARMDPIAALRSE